MLIYEQAWEGNPTVSDTFRVYVRMLELSLHVQIEQEIRAEEDRDAGRGPSKGKPSVVLDVLLTFPQVSCQYCTASISLLSRCCEKALSHACYAARIRESRCMLASAQPLR